jgi:hypothetical protein
VHLPQHNGGSAGLPPYDYLPPPVIASVDFLVDRSNHSSFLLRLRQVLDGFSRRDLTLRMALFHTADFSISEVS